MHQSLQQFWTTKHFSPSFYYLLIFDFWVSKLNGCSGFSFNPEPSLKNLRFSVGPNTAMLSFCFDRQAKSRPPLATPLAASDASGAFIGWRNSSGRLAGAQVVVVGGGRVVASDIGRPAGKHSVTMETRPSGCPRALAPRTGGRFCSFRPRFFG